MTFARTCEEGQDLADGELPGSGLRQRQVDTALITGASAASAFHDVAGRGKVGDDAVSGSLGDAPARRDVPQPLTWIVRYR